MKKLDKLVLSSIVSPFIMTFGIAWFVLIMQFLWKQIDDIMGKGAGVTMILELLFYTSVSLIPMALPIAVLISTVMVMGNFAEHYELAGMKSAGISLARVMLPMFFFCLAVATFSYFCTNNFSPVATLKFKSRLYDMKMQKPTLSLEEGVFNDDFQNVTIRIGDKNNNTGDLKDVMIYSLSAGGTKMNRILAQDGKMYATTDDKYLVMELHNGIQYQEATKAIAKNNTYPFVRTSFEEYTTIYDLGEFDMQNTDEELFKKHHEMLTRRQLALAIDSLENRLDERLESLKPYMNSYFYFLKKEEKENIDKNKPTNKQDKKNIKIPPISKKSNSTVTKKVTNPNNRSRSSFSDKKQIPSSPLPSQIIKNKGNKPRPQKARPRSAAHYKLIKPISDTLENFSQLFPEKRIKNYYSKAETLSRSVKNQAEITQTALNSIKRSKVKHQYQYYYKLSLPFACILFLFIGAPMGAIVRKGGFGYPILVAIIFFVFFIMASIIGRKASEEFSMTAMNGAWLPNYVLLPIGIFLTYKALNDAKLLDFSRIQNFFKKLAFFFRKNSKK